jgi:hypothetical protein
MSVHTESTSVKGEHQRRILTGDGPWCLFTNTGVVELAIDKLTTNVRISRSVQEQRSGAGETYRTKMSNGSSVPDESASALFAYAASEFERSRLLPEEFFRRFERSDLQDTTERQSV